MSFYIRKSIKFGPLRFNISKSGIGVSAGVRGARISNGPRGTYINLGRNGIYYRKKIDGSITDFPTVSEDDVSPQPETTKNRIPTAEVTDLLDSTNKDLLNQINSRIQQPTYANAIRGITVVIAILLGLFSLVFLYIPILLILTQVATKGS